MSHLAKAIHSRLIGFRVTDQFIFASFQPGLNLRVFFENFGISGLYSINQLSSKADLIVWENKKKEFWCKLSHLTYLESRSTGHQNDIGDSQVISGSVLAFRQEGVQILDSNSEFFNSLLVQLSSSFEHHWILRKWFIYNRYQSYYLSLHYYIVIKATHVNASECLIEDAHVEVETLIDDGPGFGFFGVESVIFGVLLN